MTRYLKIIVIYLFSLVAIPAAAQEGVAQEEVNQDDLGNVTDEFKENFFNALAEKAKGNPDRAIPLLEKCLELEPESGAVYFELGKNYLMNDAFAKAEQSISKAIQLAGRNEWLLDALYDALEKQQKNDESLELLEELAEINPNYEELLPYKYMQAGRYEDGLKMLDRLDIELGQDYNRNRLRQQLESMSGRDTKAGVVNSIANLEKQLASNPSEDLYVKLIYAYGQAGNEQKVIATAQALEDSFPESDKAQLALYRVYLDNGQLEKGVESIQRVMESSQFEEPTKVKVLNDYLQLATENDSLAMSSTSIITTFKDEVEDVDAYNALGEFYAKKQQPKLAQEFYLYGLELDGQNFELLKKAALVSIDLQDYKKVLALTGDALEIYPSQSLFYLLGGVAHNRTQQYDQAIEQLESGLLYLLDETALERDIYSELATAYTGKGDETMAAEMRSKVAALNKKIE